VNARLQALRFKSNQDEDKWKCAVLEHEQMIDALDKKDAQALQAVLLKHLHNKRDVVVMQLQNQASQATDQNKKA
jgi:DNA-binding GntR family transcriptional regulator